MQGPAPFPQGLYVPYTLMKPLAYANLPAATKKGLIAFVSDSTIATPGAVISVGGGSDLVAAYTDGTNWRVMGGVAEGGAGPSGTQYTSITGTTWTAADIAGALFTVLATSGATALTTPTGDQIIAAVPNWQIGDGYTLRIFNTNAGTLTLTAGSGVTITGTATIATNVFRDYIVTYTAADSVTLQDVGAGNAT